MLRQNAISAEGLIVECLGRGLVRAELANGHRLLAYSRGWIDESGMRLAIGQRVKLRITPFDLSKARLILNES
ncbi:MAG: S1 domain-containing protein [Limisphaerales bacterium]